MNPTDFSTRFADWQARARALDAQLAPAVKRRVAGNESGSQEALAAAPHPVDEVGVREPVEALFAEIVGCFEALDERQREQLVAFMADNENLMYRAVTAVERDTPERLRHDLILFILNDQGTDPRDALLILDGLARRARELGENPKRLFRKMARLASDRDRHGWGSTREFLSGGPGPE